MNNSEILKILYENDGKFISGEEMAKMFQISRAALSKRIAKLKEKGIEIEAITNKGYRLRSISQNICSENVSLGIDENQLIGNEVITFDEIDSTNEYAKKIAKESKEGTVVVSNIQTKGKGRRGRNFSSQKGGLYFSIILKPKAGIEKVPFLTQVSACSIYKALEDLGIKVKIKWPNDIILNEKKLSGILCEMSCEMDYISYVISGMGINTSQLKFDDDIKDIATSLAKEGYEIDKIKLFWNILKHFEYFYSRFENDDYEEMIDILRNNSSIIGKQINIISPNETSNAKAIDINENGFLVVEYEDGTIQELNYGEISIRKA